MSARKTSFWREVRRTYLLYMIAGTAAIPAALIYAVLAANGWERPWASILLLLVGVATALTAWRFAERRWLPADLNTNSGPEQPEVFDADRQGIGPTMQQPHLPKTSR